MAAAGDNKLMPSSTDCSCQIINVTTGYARNNASWVLGRMMRDYEYWINPSTSSTLVSVQRAAIQERAAKTGSNLSQYEHEQNLENYPRVGLCVAVYDAANNKEAGKPSHDAIYYSGLVVAALQMGIASIPLRLEEDWNVMLITGAGIVLAFLSGSLPQWKKEKWSCRKNSKKDVILTRGNGSQHAILIRGKNVGLDLEDLAAAQLQGGNFRAELDFKTRVALVFLALLWILLLITATGERSNPWYLLGIGTIGLLQNVMVAGFRRRPEAIGIHLDFVEVVAETKVMKTLFALEEKYEGAGRHLLPIFFPGTLRPEEIQRWEEIETGWRLKKGQPGQMGLGSGKIRSAHTA